MCLLDASSSMLASGFKILIPPRYFLSWGSYLFRLVSHCFTPWALCLLSTLLLVNLCNSRSKSYITWFASLSNEKMLLRERDLFRMILPICGASLPMTASFFSCTSSFASSLLLELVNDLLCSFMTCYSAKVWPPKKHFLDGFLPRIGEGAGALTFCSFNADSYWTWGLPAASILLSFRSELKRAKLVWRVDLS